MSSNALSTNFHLNPLLARFAVWKLDQMHGACARKIGAWALLAIAMLGHLYSANSPIADEIALTTDVPKFAGRQHCPMRADALAQSADSLRATGELGVDLTREIGQLLDFIVGPNRYWMSVAVTNRENSSLPVQPASDALSSSNAPNLQVSILLDRAALKSKASKESERDWIIAIEHQLEHLANLHQLALRSDTAWSWTLREGTSAVSWVHRGFALLHHYWWWVVLALVVKGGFFVAAIFLARRARL